MLPPHLTHRQKPRAARKLKRVPFSRLLALGPSPAVGRGMAQRLPIKPHVPELKSRLRVISR